MVRADSGEPPKQAQLGDCSKALTLTALGQRKGDLPMCFHKTWTVRSAAVAIMVLWAAPALAQFSLETSVTPEGAGIASVFPNDSLFTDGEFVTVTATALDGFAFVGWEGDVMSDESTMTFSVTSNTTLTAVFEELPPEEFELTAFVEPSGSGTIIRDPADFTYQEGTAVTLSAFADPGFVFSGWSGDIPDNADATASELTVVLTDDLDIKANFAAAQELQDGDGGPACGAFGPMGFLPVLAMMLMMRINGRS